MSKTIGFYHGALCDPYEKQANDQGFTLGDKKELLEKLGYCIVFCWIQGVLTDAQYDSALKKLQKQLVKAVTPLPEPPKEGINDPD